MNKDKYNVLVTLSNGLTMLDTVQSKHIDIKNIEKQFNDNKDFITFGTFGVKRTLIQTNSITPVPTIII